MAKNSQTFDFPSPIDQSAIKRAEKRESTRSTIALVFICGWIGIIALLVLLTTFFRLSPETAKDYLLAIGSPLGFITAFYFKSHDKD